MKAPEEIYASPAFPPAGPDRPYCFVNMVTTIDGKILSGNRDEDVLDLGSKFDHVLMKRIEAQADAVIVGAQTLRVAPPRWNPAPVTRFVVTASGSLPNGLAFIDRGAIYIATYSGSPASKQEQFKTVLAGDGTVDFRLLFHRLRNEFDVRHLLLLGGSELNAQLLALDLVDELFITIAPKVKLGRDVPTYADGDALSRDKLLTFEVVEHHVIGDEVFIRYRRTARPGIGSAA